MSYSEFPHTNYADYDNRQLIALYKDLISKYNGTLESSKQAEEKAKSAEQKVTDLTATWEQKLQQAVQQATKDIQDKYNQNIASLTQQFNNLSNKFDALTVNFQSVIVSFESNIAAMENIYIELLNQFRSNMNSNVQRQIAELRSLIEQFKSDLSKQITDSSADNLSEMNDLLKQEIADITARLEAIENTDNSSIATIWRYYMCVLGLTAQEFSEYGELTCEQWNCLRLDCYTFYTQGLRKTRLWRKQHLMYNPFNGYPSMPQQVIYEICDRMKHGALRACEYDRRGITTYCDEGVSAYEYDWNGRKGVTK